MLLMAMTAIAALADDEISVWDGSSSSSSLDVQGKKIYIHSANDFVALRNLWSKYKDGSTAYDNYTIYLETDIDLNNHNFINWAIGWDDDHKFAGNFDGKGHIIYNLKIDGKSANRGLFGWIDNGRIENLKLVNVDIHTGDGGSHVAALCGKMTNHSTISHCAVVGGDIRTYNNKDKEIGSICGWMSNNHNDVLYCYSQVDVSGYTQVGGIVGKVEQGDDHTSSIRHCYYSGQIHHYGNEYFGAIAGERYGQPLENNFYLFHHDGVLGTGNQKDSGGSSDDPNTTKKWDWEMTEPLLFGTDNLEWIYPRGGYPELKVFLRYKEGDTFYNKSIGYMGGDAANAVPGYVKVVSSEKNPYTVELAEIIKTSGSDFTLNGDFTTYFSDQPLRMVSLPNFSFGFLGEVNTVTLPATLTSIGPVQTHRVQNAFYVNGESTGCAVKDGALYDLVNNCLITAPKSFSELTIHQQYANSISNYAFQNMTNLRKLYVDTYVPAGTPVDDGDNKAPLITLNGENIFDGTPSDLDIYIKDGTTNQLFLGKQGPNLYGYSNADKWKNYYYDYADKPNHMFSYFPVSRNGGGMSTLMLGYPVELPEGVTAWWASSLSDGIVHMRPIGTQVVPPLTPVLLTYEGSSYRLDLTRYEGSDAGVATDYEGNVFKGSIDPGGHKMTSSEMMSNFFTLGRPNGETSYDHLGFYRYNPTNNVLPSYVAWIARADVPTDVRLAMDFNEETTAIRGIADQTAAADREPVVYTLQGVRISRADMRQGGIYVVNGKKVVIR